MSRRGIRVTAFEVKAAYVLAFCYRLKEKFTFGWKVIMNFELD